VRRPVLSSKPLPPEAEPFKFAPEPFHYEFAGEALRSCLLAVAARVSSAIRLLAGRPA
jgi:hypothetical protein